MLEKGEGGLWSPPRSLLLFELNRISSKNHHQFPDSAGKAKISSASSTLGASDLIYAKPQYLLSKVQRFHYLTTDPCGPAGLWMGHVKRKDAQQVILTIGCERCVGGSKFVDIKS